MKNGQHLSHDTKGEFTKTCQLSMLHTIHYRLPVDNIKKLGLEYNQIARLLSKLIQQGYIIDNEKELVLSNEGLKYLDELNKEVYPSNPQSWILPLDENRIPRIDKYEIYLPKKEANND